MPDATPLIVRGLRDAVRCCEFEYQAAMSEQVPGTRPRPEARAWRDRAKEYRELLAKLIYQPVAEEATLP
jgi:hypothetical protein